MKKNINVGVIGCEMSEDLFTFSNLNQFEKLNFRKIFTNQSAVNISSSFPGTEVVSDVKAIIYDKDIELVILSNDHLGLVNEVVRAGKSVRVSN